MKKFLLISLFFLLFSTSAFADGGIPFVLLMFPLSWVLTGVGIVLFALVVLIESFILLKSKIAEDYPKKWIYKKVCLANVLSSFVGVLIIILSEIIIPTRIIRERCDEVGLLCDFNTPGSLFFPSDLNAAFTLNMIICLLLSFVVEYLYLKKYIKNSRLMGVVFLFNLFSYIFMTLLTVPFLLFALK